MTDTLQDTLMKDLGLDELPDEERAQLADQIAGIVFQGTMLRVLDLLDEAKQEELGNLFEASTNVQNDFSKHTAIFDYLATHVPNLDAIIKQEIEQLKVEYVTHANELNKSR